MVKAICEAYHSAKKFALSETKVILWSKRSIMHQEIEKI